MKKNSYLIGGVIVAVLIVGGVFAFGGNKDDGDVAGATVSAGPAQVEDIDETSESN